MSDSDCIFCKILNGDLPSAQVYEGEDTYAFLDAKPVKMGHTLVVPKEHHRNLIDAPADVVCDVMETAHTLAPAIMESMDADGFNIHINNNEAAFQEVFHLHVHIIPRFENDRFEPWVGERDYQDGEKEEIVEKITGALDN